MNSDERQKVRSNAVRRIRWISLIVLILLAALIVTGLYLYRSMVVKPELPAVVVSQPPIITVNPETGEEETIPPAAEQPAVSSRKSADFYTILLVGTDTSSDSTDTMMLISYDVTNQRATVMSIPRDMLVNAFGTDRYTRINSVYAAYGGGDRGMDALTVEVAQLVGFMPDYRVFVSWEMVGQMVDAIGGVEYDVPFHMEYDDPTQDLHIYIEKGVQRLDGNLAMQLVRWRKNNPGVASGGGNGSDLTRLQIQQGFLKATLKQTLQIKNVGRIDDIARLFAENVEGDLKVENILWFASKAVFGGLNVDSVEFLTMPWKNANPYLCPDEEGLLALVNEKLNPFVEDITADRLDLIYFDSEGNLCATGK